jgi:hypothetical protein
MEVTMLAVERTEWVRLPGLFRWREVCAVFADGAGHDDEWRFLVSLQVPERDGSEALYAVHAAVRERPRVLKRAAP